MISARLGLDHDRGASAGRSAFPVIARYWSQRGGKARITSSGTSLLYWYIHSFLWGASRARPRRVLNQDLTHVQELDGSLDRLIEQLRSNRGDLRLTPKDFQAWSLARASIHCFTC